MLEILCIEIEIPRYEPSITPGISQLIVAANAVRHWPENDRENQ